MSKFNLKRGGVNQILAPDKLGPVLRDGKTMLVGIGMCTSPVKIEFEGGNVLTSPRCDPSQPRQCQGLS